MPAEAAATVVQQILAIVHHEHSSSVDGETRRCVTKDGDPLKGVAAVVASRELAAGLLSSAMRLQRTILTTEEEEEEEQVVVVVVVVVEWRWI